MTSPVLDQSICARPPAPFTLPQATMAATGCASRSSPKSGSRSRSRSSSPRADDPRISSFRMRPAKTHVPALFHCGDSCFPGPRSAPFRQADGRARFARAQRRRLGPGAQLFFGEQAKCGSCHKVRGRGGEIGPDLSNLVHRDYASVFRDIHSPSAAINPDYVSHTVALADGRVLNGTLRTEGDRLIVGDNTGRRTVIDRVDVEATTPSLLSVMPEGLDTTLGSEQLRDLLTFLMTDPLAPAPIEHDGEPPPRSRAELDAVLKGSAAVERPKRLTIVLSAGPKDHGPGEHDYPLWLKRWSALFATDSSVAVETANGWPSAKQLETADVIVFYSNNPGWDAARAALLDRFLAHGGGVVLIHYAVDGHETVKALADRIGLAWQGGKSAFRHGPLEIDFSNSKHPISRGFEKLRLVDESYWNLVGDLMSIELIGTGMEEGSPRPLFWTRQVGSGRVFVSIPGHFNWTFDDPLFRVLILRGVGWAANQPIDRFNELATLGARLTE